MNSEPIEMAVVQTLAAAGQTLALAESCTGGAIANAITNVPGASKIFLGGLVAYSNEIKQKFLFVPPQLLEEHGAVSEPVARAMAEGARKQFGSDYAVAVTGIAGPGGGTMEKPVGTVFISVASARGTMVERRLNPGDRLDFKVKTVQLALNMLLVSTKLST